MKKIFFLSSVLALSTSCSTGNKAQANTEHENDLLRKWVLSRCIGHATSDALMKQDAFNSASAYLELSKSPVERFVHYETSIKDVLEKSPSGSIEGSFKVKTCIDYVQSLHF